MKRLLVEKQSSLGVNCVLSSPIFWNSSTQSSCSSSRIANGRLPSMIQIITQQREIRSSLLLSALPRKQFLLENIKFPLKFQELLFSMWLPSVSMSLEQRPQSIRVTRCKSFPQEFPTVMLSSLISLWQNPEACRMLSQLKS